ncbi:MAG: RpiB/LacA/LacB family sugar-phosphate isomerase [Magnetococcus sp. WYHC-3]
MRIALGCNHEGHEFVARLGEWMAKTSFAGIDVLEITALQRVDSQSLEDYPRFARGVCQGLMVGDYHRGILVGTSGVGMSITANRFPRVRAVLCNDCFTAAMSRRWNDANVLVLGSHAVTMEMAQQVVRVWLETPFEGGRYQELVDHINQPVDVGFG